MDVNRRALIAVVVAIVIAGVAGWLYSQCQKPEETSIPYYFIAIHSEPHNEFLHFKDPSGERSRTVSEIIEPGLLPEETIPEELVNSKLPPLPPAINH